MQILTLIIIILFVFVIFLGIFVFILNRRIKKLTLGTTAQSLEEIIQENQKRTLDLLTKEQEHNIRIKKLEEDSLHNLKNIGVVRFNPFKELGGSQSFALAFLNQKKNGVVISSLYARDRINVFAKPIIDGSSQYTLSKEEQEAIGLSLK